MAAPKEIVDLVERFESNIASYKDARYNETQVRREFIDPLTQDEIKIVEDALAK